MSCRVTASFRQVLPVSPSAACCGHGRARMNRRPRFHAAAWTLLCVLASLPSAARGNGGGADPLMRSVPPLHLRFTGAEGGRSLIPPAPDGRRFSGVRPSVRRLQVPAATETLDFLLPYQEASATGTEQVVTSYVNVSGRFDQSMLNEVVSCVEAALVAACNMSAPLITFLLQDIASFGQPVLAVTLFYWTLPPFGGESECATNTAIAVYGKPEPQWGEGLGLGPKPVFRSLLEYELSRNLLTVGLDSYSWYVASPPPICEERNVIYEENHPDADAWEFTMGTPLCTDEMVCEGCRDLSKMWEPSDQSEVWVSPSQMCDYGGDACICASLPSCTWQEEAGGFRCRGYSYTNVSCSHCSSQPQCPDTGDGCSDALTGCSCAGRKSIPCKWDISTDLCRPMVDGEGATSCTACHEQDHCDLPKIEKIKPTAMSALPTPQDGHFINVTFDRPVWLGNGSDLLIYLQCGGAMFGMEGPSTTFSIAREQVNFESPTMAIDVLGIVNPDTVDCDLIVYENAVADERGLPFAGMELREFTFTLADTQGPVLLDFDPANGAADVVLNTLTTFFFDEECVVGSDPRAVLYVLGGMFNDSNLTRPADAPVAEIRLDGPLAAFVGNTLKLDVSQYLGTYEIYSIELVENAVADGLQNGGAGLPPRVYTFRTAPVPVAVTTTVLTVEEDDDDEPIITYVLYVLAASAGLLFIAGLIMLCFSIYTKKTTIATKVMVMEALDAEELAMSPKPGHSAGQKGLNIDATIEEMLVDPVQASVEILTEALGAEQQPNITPEKIKTFDFTQSLELRALELSSSGTLGGAVALGHDRSRHLSPRSTSRFSGKLSPGSTLRSSAQRSPTSTRGSSPLGGTLRSTSSRPQVSDPLSPGIGGARSPLSPTSTTTPAEIATEWSRRRGGAGGRQMPRRHYLYAASPSPVSPTSPTSAQTTHANAPWGVPSSEALMAALGDVDPGSPVSPASPDDSHPFGPESATSPAVADPASPGQPGRKRARRARNAAPGHTPGRRGMWFDPPRGHGPVTFKDV